AGTVAAANAELNKAKNSRALLRETSDVVTGRPSLRSPPQFAALQLVHCVTGDPQLDKLRVSQKLRPTESRMGSAVARCESASSIIGANWRAMVKIGLLSATRPQDERA